MRYTHIIWDFNGTLIDDVTTGINSINIVMRRRSMPTLESTEQYHGLFGFPIRDYYARLGFDFSRERYDDVALEWAAEYEYQSRFAPLCGGVEKALEYFSGLGLKQIVLSMSELGIMCRQLREKGILGVFDRVYGLDNVLAESKLSLAQSLREQLSGGKLLMLGDTTHDCETAKVLGADCVLIASGHENKRQLLQCGAAVVDSADELPELFSRFYS